MGRILFVLFVAVSLASCSLEQHSCTEIGCLDQAQVTIRTPNGEWQAGEYSLSIAFDSAEHTCSFVAPDDFSANGSIHTLDCEPALEASIHLLVTCEEHEDDDSSSQTCTPIPSQFSIEAWVQGTPEGVTFTLERDATELLTDSKDFAYADYQPNGPECEPTCRQASVEIQVP